MWDNSEEFIENVRNSLFVFQLDVQLFIVNALRMLSIHSAGARFTRTGCLLEIQWVAFFPLRRAQRATM
jgi:hypothetical protein